VKQLDAEPLVVVDVDDRPGAQVKRRAVALHPRLRATAAGIVELGAVAEAERDVEEPQVADAVALGPRTARRIRVGDQLDQEVVRPQAHALALRPVQAP
jgi:hypothetical protein